MRLLPLCVALVLSTAAWAQKAVVIDIDGDARGRLQAQIAGAVQADGAVTLVPYRLYRKAATAQGVRGAAAGTAAGVARVGKRLAFDAAVGGEVAGNSYTVVIYDRRGQVLWTRKLAVQRGLLSRDFAGRLARAIAAAAGQGAQQPPEAAPAPEGVTDDGGDDGEVGGAEETQTVEVDEPEVTAPVARQTAVPQVDPDRDADLDREGRRRSRRSGFKTDDAEVPVVRGFVAGLTTWRSQCLRPGVTSCKEYDWQTPKPRGDPVDFTASVPYLGFVAGVEVYPLARVGNAWLRGLAVVGDLHYGQSLTRIVESSAQGQGESNTVASSDLGWNVQLAWRYFFAMGYGKPTPLAYVGLRAGLSGQTFSIDTTAPVPSSVRTAPTGIGYPAFGLDASVPVASFFRVDLGASLFIDPHTAPEQVVGYGNLSDPTGGVASTGWSLTGGFSGDVWGPLGWMVQVRYSAFGDRYYGQGQKWTVCNDVQCGGVGEESFVRLVWGLSARY